jgi:hypothetical protein
VSSVPPDRRPPQPEIEDLRPPNYWGRHPLTKVVLFGSLGAGVYGPLWVGDDTGTLLVAFAGAVVTIMSFAGAVGAMRGYVSPLPGRDMKLLSPIAGIVWGAAFLVTCIALALGVLTSMDEPATWFKAAAALAGVLVLVGLYIQIASLSDQWPDKWRPPYARQPPPEDPASPAPATDAPADDGPERST